MEALFQIVSFLIDYAVKGVQDALNADVKHRIFEKAGDVQNAVTNNLQNQYGQLQSNISAAALLQYQTNLQDETQKKVIVGNIISVISAAFVMLMLVILFFLLVKK